MVHQIRTIVRALERLGERVVVKITLDVTANLKEATPRDTGWAAVNWVPAIGAPFVEDIGDLAREERQFMVSAGESQQATAVAGIAGYRLRRGRVFVTNNVPYIRDLNNGSSRKAPKAFIQIAIKKAVTVDIRGLVTR